MRNKILNIVILIIEDDKFMNEIISEVLESEGYAIESAVSANEAIKKIEQGRGKFQLLVLDYNLEDVNGKTGLDIFEMAKKFNSNVKGIMISAYTEKRIAEKSKAQGIYKFINKPFLISDLINSVNDVALEFSREKLNKKLSGTY